MDDKIETQPYHTGELQVLNRYKTSNTYTGIVFCSVADTWHFDVDPDLDPRIHASD